MGLSVKPAFANALAARLPFAPSGPLEASVTLLEATTPVKLPAKRCPNLLVRPRAWKGWYFNLRLHQGQSPDFLVSHLSYASHVQDQR